MKIFISYRRAEDNKSYIVGTVHERIAKVFGKDNVFRDTYDIAGGADWKQVLHREIHGCKVMLVIIGQDWASLAHPNGEKRLFDPEDVTRWEVETGLRRSIEENITVIPVLVTGAQIPKVEELPESLHQLLDKNVINLRNFPDFDNDMEKLVRDIRSSQGFREDDITIELFEPKTIHIAEGSFLMGSTLEEDNADYEPLQHEVYLPAYRIGKYPVTNEQYEEFVRQTERPLGDIVGWDGRKPKEGREQKPVMGVRWDDAREYCEWLSKETGRKYSLPNEAQLEKAYRGSYGCSDIVDNLHQWTCTLWGVNADSPDLKYRSPWKDDGRNNMNANNNRQIRRVVCVFPKVAEINAPVLRRRTGQRPDDPGLPGERHGFRVVMSI